MGGVGNYLAPAISAPLRMSVGGGGVGCARISANLTDIPTFYK